VVKLLLNSSKIAEDITMIELQGYSKPPFLGVMEEFGALVEKSRVVLVCFDHKKAGIG